MSREPTDDTIGGDLLRGTLEMLVLQILRGGPMHGWAITERLEQWSGEVLQIGQGSLYPALYRLERHGLVRSEWGQTPENRRARYYVLSAAGQREVTRVTASWRRFSHAIGAVLRAAEAGS